MSEPEGYLVPPGFAKELCEAFDVKLYQVGLAPVPWRVRIWRKVSFARWRVERMIAREESRGAA